MIFHGNPKIRSTFGKEQVSLLSDNNSFCGAIDMVFQRNWDGLDTGKFAVEADVIAALLASEPINPAARKDVVEQAARLVERTRTSASKQGVVESFLKEFSLGTREGLALMCLAEALLRTPDADTVRWKASGRPRASDRQ